MCKQIIIGIRVLGEVRKCVQNLLVVLKREDKQCYLVLVKFCFGGDVWVLGVWICQMDGGQDLVCVLFEGCNIVGKINK